MTASKTITALAAGAALAMTPALALASGNTNSAARSAAQKQCRQERTTLGTSTFDQANGTNKSKSNAFGKCVSRRTAQNTTDQSKAQGAAVKECRSEQSDPNFASSHNGDTFNQFYGTGKTQRDAFGRCVSSHAKAMTESAEASQVKAEENAAKQCRTEQQANPAAFKTKWGTNADKSNAFGKCVSTKAKAQEQNSSTTSG